MTLYKIQMKRQQKLGFIIALVLLSSVIVSFSVHHSQNNQKILSYTVDLKKQDLRLYWKDTNGQRFQNFKNLKTWMNSQSNKLIFAMNGGMYQSDGSPQGLYIEKGKLLSKIDTIQKSFGNFYLQPNGIFYITKDKKGVVCKTQGFKNKNVLYATQSGPMLLIDSNIHPKFNKNSKNLNIRNGVGILPDGKLLFAMSKEKISFYEFADFFKSKGCKNALYLDGFVSRTYLPSKNWTQIDGEFGVIIAEAKHEKK